MKNVVAFAKAMVELTVFLTVLTGLIALFMAGTECQMSAEYDYAVASSAK